MTWRRWIWVLIRNAWWDRHDEYITITEERKRVW
jgi:hypothetical protein